MADINPYTKFAPPAANPYAKYAAPPAPPQKDPQLQTAAPPQSGQSPWTENFVNNVGDILGLGIGHGPPKPTGILPYDTLREYPYQLESALRGGAEMFGHGTRAMGQGKLSGLIGQIAGGAQALGAPGSALFGPISRPIHDWIGNPAEKLTGIPGTADVVTAAVPAALGMVVPEAGGTRVNEPAPPGTQVGTYVGGDKARIQREAVLNNLQAAKKAAYGESKAAGVIIRPDVLKSAADAIENDLAQEGYHPDDQPAIGRFFNRLRNDVDNGNPVTLDHFDVLRKQLVGITKDFTNENQARLARQAIGQFDSIDLDAGAVQGQNGQPLTTAGINALYRGRALAKTQAKADLIGTALDVANNNANKSPNANHALALRQQLTNILNNVDRGRIKFLTKDEIASLRVAASHQGHVLPILNALSKLAPEHGLGLAADLLAGGVTGLAAGGPIGLAASGTLMGVGAGSKLGSEMIQNARANRLFNQVARGQPPKQVSGPFEPPASPGLGGGPQGPGPRPTGPTPQPSTPTGPRIVSAATRIDGKTYTGRTHADAVETWMRETGKSIDDIPDDVFEGFVTSDGRLVDRATAAHMMKDKQGSIASEDIEHIQGGPLGSGSQVLRPRNENQWRDRRRSLTSRLN